MYASVLVSGRNEKMARETRHADVNNHLPWTPVRDALYSTLAGESMYLFAENADVGCRQHNILLRGDVLTQFGAVLLKHLFNVLPEDIDVF